MSNIATGIALSGALETSTKGKEAQLAAAKFGAEKRIEEQRLKDKERSENEKDIRKNTSFDPQYENALIQDLHEKEAVEKIAGIAEGLGSEDVNVMVEAEKGLKEFKHGMKEREIMDKQMTEMLSAAKEPSKYDISDPHIIGGFQYDNALQALEDKRNWTPEMLKDIGEKFNSSFFDLSVDDQTGKPSINFNPLGAVVMDYDTEIFKGITEEEFSIEGKPKSYQLGNTMKEMSDLYPSPEGVMRSSIAVAGDPRAQATAFRRAYKDAKASNPDLSEAKFLEEGQRQHEARLQAGEQGIAPTFREEVINTQFERSAEDALKRVGGRREISAKELQTSAPPQSAAKKALGDINIAVSSLGEGGAIATINTPGKDIIGNIQLSSFDQFFGIGKNQATGKNEKMWQKLGRKTTVTKVTPVGIEFHGSDNADITYTSEYNKDGVKGGMNEYKVALNTQSFQQLSSMLGVDKANELLEKMRDASQPGQYKYADEWLDKLGLKRSSDAAAPASGSAPKKPSFQ